MTNTELKRLFDRCNTENVNFDDLCKANEVGLVAAQVRTAASRGCDGSLFEPGDVTIHVYMAEQFNLPTWITNRPISKER